jgi:hypothetical protein
MDSVFTLQHLHVFPDGQECNKFIGVYSNEVSAKAAVERLKIQPGFCDHPKIIDPLLEDYISGFYIDEYSIDKDHWAEGYVTV